MIPRNDTIAFVDALLSHLPAEKRHERMKPTLERIQVFVSGMPWWTQFLLKAMFWIWEYSAVLFYFRPFSQLSPDRRKTYIERAGHSRIGMFRDLTRVLRGLCYTAYFNLQDTWTDLGYAPESFIQKAIDERRRHLSWLQRHYEQDRDLLMTFMQNSYEVAGAEWNMVSSMEILNLTAKTSGAAEQVAL